MDNFTDYALRSLHNAAVSEEFDQNVDNYYAEYNISTGSNYEPHEPLPLSYRVVATIMHSVIFCMGVVGNIVLILVAHRSSALRTPTYTYLVSLAYADLLVICCAIPEAILSYHVGNRWVLGNVPCAIFIFLNFLGINAGSLSILAFTVERFIAVCYPLIARKMCTLQRTKKIVLVAWVCTILYCAPWLGLTEIQPDEYDPSVEQCRMRLTREIYLVFFLADILLFYVTPLLVAVIAYARIGRIIQKRTTLLRRGGSKHWLQTPNGSGSDPVESPLEMPLSMSMDQNGSNLTGPRSPSYVDYPAVFRSKVPVLQMLIVIVVLFAVSWLPFRGLLVYNSFVHTPWLDIWYVLFAKTLIYANAAMNPFLYNVMSKRFHVAVRQYIWRRKKAVKTKKLPKSS